ncbi:MAG: HNH endonuclease domain-containing protein [Phycisphaerales bacterium]
MSGRLPPPSDGFTLAFLDKVERILSTGGFTSTYKFALLIALANLAVEQGDDSGEPLELDLDDVARHFLALYWGMARPYPGVSKVLVLRQSTLEQKPSTMITMLGDATRHAASSYARLRTHQTGRDGLVGSTRRTIAKDVLYRLQNVPTGDGRERSMDRFLYEHPPTAKECGRLRSITLLPGVGACLRRLHGVIVSMVQARWTRFVRENNPSLGPDRELESFLFGADRRSVSQYAERLYELQGGRCFYTHARLLRPRAAEVDHFIPWSRYPWDSPFNLVLASAAANQHKRDRLAPSEALDRWLDRNDRCLEELIAPPPKGFGAAIGDRATARTVAAWIYRRYERDIA